jgi:hypothetical protein
MPGRQVCGLKNSETFNTLHRGVFRAQGVLFDKLNRALPVVNPYNAIGYQ